MIKNDDSLYRKRSEIFPHKKGFYEKYFKRPLDFILSLSALIALSPIILLTGVAVRTRLGKPVLFTQDRPGLDNRIFKIYKFRTMNDKRDENGNLLKDIYRLTAFGKFLRSTSLDELPELFNIVKGDMAIVGPRPLLVRYLDRYSDEQRRRNEVRPGLTGLAMSRVRNSAGWNKKFELDTKYVDNVSFLLDVKIILWTIKIVLKREGINETGGTSATNSEFMGDEK
ncbi:sugar transferase [Ruminococcus sp. OA3]|uniref:sugar transferase n=1 Tax=Ruminococcus sp. OA3 TaxID=2914164 RepID=UPI001F064921|nr:sugar transferase [Ruminococcus sp. OA3]MCH1982903.1 sugar transferase [Ruminococcus sp. OA3]